MKYETHRKAGGNAVTGQQSLDSFLSSELSPSQERWTGSVQLCQSGLENILKEPSWSHDMQTVKRLTLLAALFFYKNTVTGPPPDAGAEPDSLCDQH